jgi:hypothetical protein
MFLQTESQEKCGCHGMSILLSRIMKSVALFILSSFIVIYGRRAGLLPVTPSWLEEETTI